MIDNERGRRKTARRAACTQNSTMDTSRQAPGMIDAVFLTQPLVWLIPLVAVLYPRFRPAPAIYDWVERRRVYRLYSELKRLEDEIFYTGPHTPNTPSNDFIERLDRLKERASRLSVPATFKPLVYALRLHLDMVRQEVQKSISPEFK